SRSHAYASPRSLPSPLATRHAPPRRKACYRPAWLALTGRVSHPRDASSVFQFGTAPRFLTDQPFLVALAVHYCARGLLEGARQDRSSRRVRSARADPIRLFEPADSANSER